jgi:hypothetical protein
MDMSRKEFLARMRQSNVIYVTLCLLEITGYEKNSVEVRMPSNDFPTSFQIPYLLRKTDFFKTKRLNQMRFF